MSDKYEEATPVLGSQIRTLRRAAGLTLEGLARRTGTSAPTIHRYESGWDRFELATLRRIAAGLGASLEVRLVPGPGPARDGRPSRAALRRLLAPLFWDRDLSTEDLETSQDWVLARVLTAGGLEQVRAVRAAFGDRAILRAVRRRDVDARTRNYWRLILGGA
ncbi:MAG: helix-turn-helix domain-containing protein [Acidobacteria bacterium]|jgi:transcriptional regulator with XRE-family HTH domain|nr:helix-turn-helix domain-containing protein [Acidobacteriota bacterium]